MRFGIDFAKQSGTRVPFVMTSKSNVRGWWRPCGSGACWATASIDVTDALLDERRESESLGLQTLTGLST